MDVRVNGVCVWMLLCTENIRIASEYVNLGAARVFSISVWMHVCV